MTVSLDFPQGTPIRVGTPFPLDIVITGAAEQPVYAIEFDLTYAPVDLHLVSVQGSPAFLGPYGYWAITPSLAEANISRNLSDSAVVRLGAVNGISDGPVVRLYLVPQVVTGESRLQISNVLLADSSGETYTADQVDGTEDISILPVQLFLPVLTR
jgi:hypothetical protein